jgi:hypothetical protein
MVKEGFGDVNRKILHLSKLRAGFSPFNRQGVLGHIAA